MLSNDNRAPSGELTLQNSQNPTAGVSAQKAKDAKSRYPLVRYFLLTALGLFIVVALALTYFDREQVSFFRDVQEKQNAFFKKVQDDFAKQQDAAARRDLLAVHESGNVNLTRLFANTLWERDFAPFVAKAQSVSVDKCRAMADAEVHPDQIDYVNLHGTSTDLNAGVREAGSVVVGTRTFASG